ncbi:hypothetical protein [Roseicyclus marinus]|uniref:hypothetical protein n=1 Tax=Roseicyclus marinus TaxID=2161673 RepID=UPI00240EB7E9|nr:hypothetical protein [Roseicyclus marinus]MDG3040470.1 hypothetical protein [Roseicyclus marinus]
MTDKNTDLTFVDQVEISKRLQKIARLIDKQLAKATGGKRVPFSLYTWGGHRAQYVSNVARDDAKVAMQECLDRWSEHQDPPPHEFQG